MISYRIELKRSVSQAFDILKGNNNEVIFCAEKSNKFKKDYEYLESLHYFTRMGISAFELENLTEESFNKLSETTAAEDIEESIYYLDSDKNVIGSLAKNDLNLSDEEFEKLVKEGQYENSDFLFYSVKTDSYYLILSREKAQSNSKNFDLIFPDNYSFYLKNLETGKIVKTNISNAQISANNFDDKVVNSKYEIEDEKSEMVEMYVSGVKNICVTTVFDLNGQKFEAGSMFPSKEFEVIVFYVPFVTCILLGVYAAMVFYAVIHLKKKVTEKEIHVEHKVFSRNLIRTVIIIGLIIAFYTIYFFSSTRVLQYYSVSDSALTDIISAADTYKKNSNKIYSESYAAGKFIADDIAEALQYDYIESKDELLEKLAEVVGAKEITVYDKDGVIEYTTTKYKGYSLPKDENNPRSRFWSILQGGTSDMSISSENSSVVDFAVCRLDKVGMVLLSVDLDEINNLLCKVSYSELIKFYDYEYFEQMYSERSEPEKLYIVKDGSSVEISTNNNLVMNADGESLFSVRKIQLQKYLINSLGSEDKVTMLGYSTAEVVEDSIYFTLRTISAYILIAAIVFMLYGKSDSQDNTDSFEEKKYEDILKEETKKIETQIFPISAIMAIVLSICVHFFFGDISNILSAVDDLDKGFNLLSITSIMLYLGLSIGGISILSFISSFFNKVSNPKTATIISLLCSVLKTLIIVVFSVFSLKQLGVNTTAITAGLGLSGLAVGIGSKEIINDLVAGIFIIFEGQIQVGDYISVDDFYGEVTCLGIRTTKIKRFQKELIINNSNLKNVINLSRGTSFAYFTFVFELNTDLTKLSEVIISSADRLSEAVNRRITGKIIIIGVEEVTDIGLKFSFGTFVINEAYRKRVQNMGNAELVKIFAENGFKLAVANKISLQPTQEEDI